MASASKLLPDPLAPITATTSPSWIVIFNLRMTCILCSRNPLLYTRKESAKSSTSKRGGFPFSIFVKVNDLTLLSVHEKDQSICASSVQAYQKGQPSIVMTDPGKRPATTCQ